MGAMKSEISFDIGNEGILIMLERRPGNIEVELRDGWSVIRYAVKVHFFRALVKKSKMVRFNR